MHALVEGYLDGRLLITLMRQLRITDSNLVIRDAGGHHNFWKIAEQYNAAGRHRVLIGLADLEQISCASQQLNSLTGGLSSGFRLRLAVRMIESWIVADRTAFASFLGVPVSRIPAEPDLEVHPKRLIGELAKHSSRRAIREGLAPQHSSALVGPEFTASMARFIDTNWDSGRARKHSPSLNRACARWGEL